MNEPATETTAVATAEDVSELHCPLCDYNLRGLEEPRCPECGAKFDWDELRNPARRLHPYLFEHHPQRNVRSFFRTLVGGLRPGKFWKTLLPVQPSNPRRLIIYWLVCMILAALPLAVQFAVDVGRLYHSVTTRRALLTNYYLGSGVTFGSVRTPRKATPGETASLARQWGSVQKWIDYDSPPPFSREFFGLIWSTSRSSSAPPYEPGLMLRIIRATLVLALVWPWLTAVIMLLFRASMKRAAVRPIHLLRVTLYSSDWIVWIGMLLIFYIAVENLDVILQRAASLTYALHRVRAYVGYEFLGLLAIGATYRLGRGIGRYLRFRHAMAMAISVQIIFALLTLQMLVLFG